MLIVPYTYFIYNKITDQFYIGSRKANVAANRTPKEDLWVHYFTSSNLVETLRTEYGADSFHTEVIYTEKEYDHPDEYYWYEQQIIKENLYHPLCLNQHYFDPDTKSRRFKNKNKSYILTEEEQFNLSRGGWIKIWNTPAYRVRYKETRSNISVISEATGLTIEKVKVEFLKKEINKKIIEYQNLSKKELKLKLFNREY